MSKTSPKFGAAVVARMTSSRLPGKVLSRVAGKPLLQYTLERLRKSKLDIEVVIATSEETSDDPLAEFAEQSGISCVRGSLEDVAGRFLMAIRETGVDAMFRVNGDSPLIDPALFCRAANTYRESSPDLITNIMPRHYPPGVSVELVKATAYREAYSLMKEAEDKEHVTRFFYRNSEKFKINNLEPETPYPGIHLAIDTADDLAIFSKMVDQMNKPHWEYTLNEIVDFYNAS